MDRKSVLLSARSVFAFGFCPSSALRSLGTGKREVGGAVMHNGVGKLRGIIQLTKISIGLVTAQRRIHRSRLCTSPCAPFAPSQMTPMLAQDTEEKVDTVIGIDLAQRAL